jgi:hypothetical protein
MIQHHTKHKYSQILSNKGTEEESPYTHLKDGIFEDHQITPFIQASHFWET